jgi:hypothetical protein
MLKPKPYFTSIRKQYHPSEEQVDIKPARDPLRGIECAMQKDEIGKRG